MCVFICFHTSSGDFEGVATFQNLILPKLRASEWAEVGGVRKSPDAVSQFNV